MQINPQRKEINIPANERVKEEKKKRVPPKTCPNKTSLWFITINTNIYLNDKSEHEATAIKQRFGQVMDDILPTFDHFIEMKTSKLGEKFGFSKDDPRQVLCGKDRILEHKLDWVMELSPSGRLHAHIMFFLRKKGVDTKVLTGEIKKAVDSKMNISSYVNYKLSPAMMNLEEYMRKNPLEN